MANKQKRQRTEAALGKEKWSTYWTEQCGLGWAGCRHPNPFQSGLPRRNSTWCQALNHPQSGSPPGRTSRVSGETNNNNNLKKQSVELHELVHVLCNNKMIQSSTALQTVIHDCQREQKQLVPKTSRPPASGPPEFKQTATAEESNRADCVHVRFFSSAGELTTLLQ